MSDAQRDPHVLISARASEHPKIIDLPSDKARWGWIVLMGKAKLQRPAGRFASLRVLDSVLGEYRRFVDPYLKVGVLEQVGHLCPACAGWIPQIDRRPGEYVIHDWEVHQKSRTTQWRAENGVVSGRQNKSGNQPGNTGETPGETSGETSGNNPPAGGRASQSLSLSSSSSSEGGPGGTAPLPPYVPPGSPADFDALDVYHELTGYRPWGEWSGDELRALVADYTDPVVQAALRVEWDAKHDRKGLLKATQAHLARDAERAQRAAVRKPVIRPVIDEAANQRELARLMGRK